LSALPSVPSVPPEQDAPVPPEEIDVTIVDSRTSAQVGARAEHGRVAVAAPPAPAASRPAAAHPGPRRDPQSRLEALFDAGTLELYRRLLD